MCMWSSVYRIIDEDYAVYMISAKITKAVFSSSRLSNSSRLMEFSSIAR